MDESKIEVEEQRIMSAADEQLTDPRDRNFKTVLKLTGIIGPVWIAIVIGFFFSAAQVSIEIHENH
jgi:hypothetical protein